MVSLTNPLLGGNTTQPTPFLSPFSLLSFPKSRVETLTCARDFPSILSLLHQITTPPSPPKTLTLILHPQIPSFPTNRSRSSSPATATSSAPPCTASFSSSASPTFSYPPAPTSTLTSPANPTWNPSFSATSPSTSSSPLPRSVASTPTPPSPSTSSPSTSRSRPTSSPPPSDPLRTSSFSDPPAYTRNTLPNPYPNLHSSPCCWTTPTSGTPSPRSSTSRQARYPVVVVADPLHRHHHLHLAADSQQVFAMSPCDFFSTNEIHATCCQRHSPILVIHLKAVRA